MDTEGRLKLEEQDCEIEPPPRKKLKARRGASAVPEADNMDWGVEDPSTQTLPVYGGPDHLTLRRFDLWKEGRLCDCTLVCSDGTRIKANRLELAAWSQHFSDEFSHSPSAWNGPAMEVSAGSADSEMLAILVRALYEKEITITPRNATELLALAHSLQIQAITQVVETYLISRCNHQNAIELLLLAEKHDCVNLKQTAIPLTATNFDRIDPDQLVLLTCADLKLLLASNQLSSPEEHQLFDIIKRWSQGPKAGVGGQSVEQQLLSLVGQIRLEHVGPHHLNSILDDPWLQQHPQVLSAVAKGLVRKAEMSPLNRKNRVGELVRFKQWTAKVRELKARNSREPLYSDYFQLPMLTDGGTQWHIQAFPQGFTTYPGKLGLYLARTVSNEKENQDSALDLRFRITLVNQHNAKDSITGEFTHPSYSPGGTQQFWGSRQFANADVLDKGFLVNDTLCINVLALPQDPKFSQSCPGGKRAFSLIGQAEKAPMSAKTNTPDAVDA